VSKAGAQGVMQFMPGTAKEMGLVDRTDPIASIDAGARYMRKLYDAYGSWDAAIAHYNGGGTQAAIVRGGGRPTYNETAGYLDRVQKYVAEHTAQQVAKSPEVVDAARVAVLNETVAKSLPDTPDAMAQMQRAADIVAESGGRLAEVELMPTESPVRVARMETELAQIEDRMTMLAEPLALPGRIEPLSRKFFDEEGSPIGRSYADMTPEEKASFDLRQGIPGGKREEVEAVAARQELALLQHRIQTAGFGQKRLDAIFTPGEFKAADVMRTAEADVERAQLKVQAAELRASIAKERATAPAPGEREEGAFRVQREPETNALPDPGSVKLAGDEPAPRGAEVGAVRNEAGQALPTDAEAAKPSEAGSIDALMAQKLAAEQPDLQVILPGTDTPISVKEAMARIAEEQKQDTQWGDLVRVAAECALMA
jgi:hypothetical protein